MRGRYSLDITDKTDKWNAVASSDITYIFVNLRFTDNNSLEI